MTAVFIRIRQINLDPVFLAPEKRVLHFFKLTSHLNYFQHEPGEGERCDWGWGHYSEQLGLNA